MPEEEKGLGSGTVLLSFLTGAALGIGLVVLYAQNQRHSIESEYDEGPLFI